MQKVFCGLFLFGMMVACNAEAKTLNSGVTLNQLLTIDLQSGKKTKILLSKAGQ